MTRDPEHRRAALIAAAAILAVGAAVGVAVGIDSGLTVAKPHLSSSFEPSTSPRPVLPDRILRDDGTLPPTTSTAPTSLPVSTPPTTAPPAGTVEVTPGQDLAALVAAAPAGTRFTLAAGTYPGASVQPKDRDQFIGSPGTVLDGGKVLTGFTPSAGHWVAPAGPASPAGNGQCLPGYPMCTSPNDLYLGSTLLRRVSSAAAVTAGTWFYDTAAGTAVLGADPTGRQVILTKTPQAFGGSATAVVLTHLTIRHYATPAQVGTVDASHGMGWNLSDVEISDNHGGGLILGTDSTVSDCVLQRDGQQGIGATGSNVHVSGCDIGWNNTAGYDPGWSAGGSKFTATNGLVVSDCRVHDNVGPGLWEDGDNVDGTLRGNTIFDNAQAGVFIEISYTTLIADNVVTGNAAANHGPYFTANGGITVSASSDVEVVGNRVSGNGHEIIGFQQNRGSGAYGPHLLRNLWVHDNTVGLTAGSQVGVATDTGSLGVYQSNNRFDDNAYLSGQTFGWMNAEQGRTGWQAAGQDRHATFG